MVFITSSGLTVNLHYCAGKLANVSLQNNHANCMMSQTSNKSASKDCDKSMGKKDLCCQNHKVITKTDNKTTVKKDNENNAFVKTFSFVSTYFTSLFSFSNDDANEKEDTEISIFPILKEGLYILLQNFRN
ncbi:hypothetical protein A5893_04060 [Pedobacter psychrophilus]|uniref:Uncharacterized protein n=2 Tax=Pedobacter psychrophilus TaxID=1826909 RepID=A0A179DML7_9SPHI|nr:hypothetical protein A5893_04060 [Pedobacter psychrophilus]